VWVVGMYIFVLYKGMMMFSSWCTHCVQRPQKNVWLLAPIPHVVPLTLVDESKCLAVLQYLSYTLVMCTNPCRGWMWDEDGEKELHTLCDSLIHMIQKLATLEKKNSWLWYHVHLNHTRFRTLYTRGWSGCKFSY
jgi:hypothetical protein